MWIWALSQNITWPRVTETVQSYNSDQGRQLPIRFIMEQALKTTRKNIRAIFLFKLVNISKSKSIGVYWPFHICDEGGRCGNNETSEFVMYVVRIYCLEPECQGLCFFVPVFTSSTTVGQGVCVCVCLFVVTYLPTPNQQSLSHLNHY